MWYIEVWDGELEVSYRGTKRVADISRLVAGPWSSEAQAVASLPAVKADLTQIYLRRLWANNLDRGKEIGVIK